MSPQSPLVDVQHDLATDAAFEKGGERVGHVVPEAVELDRAVQTAGRHELGEEAEVAGRVRLGPELVRQVEGVDARALGPVEPTGPEVDQPVWILRTDADHDSARSDVFDRPAECLAAEVVEDHVEVAGELR